MVILSPWYHPNSMGIPIRKTGISMRKKNYSLWFFVSIKCHACTLIKSTCLNPCWFSGPDLLFHFLPGPFNQFYLEKDFIIDDCLRSGDVINHKLCRPGLTFPLGWNKDSNVRVWWHHDKEMISALPALCEGNPPVIGGFPLQRASNA